MEKIHVISEIGKLKKVLLHRPGLELEHLTPKWLHQLLFDDIPWLKEAQNEHDAFKLSLENEGVEVVYLEDLVSQSIQDLKIKHQFIDQFIIESAITNAHTIKRLKDYLLALGTKKMVQEMMAGIPKDKVKGIQTLSLKERIEDYPFVTDPMPNLYFTRDPFAVLLNGVSIHKMYATVRARETIFAQYVFNYHPDYKDVPQFYSRDYAASIEGGDILVLNNETIAIGISERTDPDAIEILSKNLFKKTSVKQVIAINLPKRRTFMHLDTVLTQVDYHTFLIHHDFLGKLDTYIIQPSLKSSGLKINHKHETLKRVLSRILKNAITMIPCGGDDPIASDREQWNDGANALAISPGKVIVYERNTLTNKLLEDHGITIIPIKSGELSRGRGGPRCMSMPLIRSS